MVKHLFTGDVAVGTCSDCKPTHAPPEKVSNLLSKPEMNVKYDDAWFLKHNPQYWNNLRTTGLLSEVTAPSADPIMQLNPTLYKQVAVQSAADNFKDPFHQIMESQHQWICTNQKYGFVKDMVYRTDIDHPNSMHNQVTAQGLKVNFPKTSD